MNVMVTCLIFLLLLSCSREQRKEKASVEGPGVTTAPIRPEDREEERGAAETPFDIDSFDDIGRIEKLTPELFVKVTVLYRKESKVWLDKAKTMPAGEQEKFIEDVNRKFFSYLGLTEEEYTGFSANNIDELNAYMELHPELLPFFMEK